MVRTDEEDDDHHSDPGRPSGHPRRRLGSRRLGASALPAWGLAARGFGSAGVDPGLLVRPVAMRWSYRPMPSPEPDARQHLGLVGGDARGGVQHALEGAGRLQHRGRDGRGGACRGARGRHRERLGQGDIADVGGRPIWSRRRDSIRDGTASAPARSSRFLGLLVGSAQLGLDLHGGDRRGGGPVRTGFTRAPPKAATTKRPSRKRRKAVRQLDTSAESADCSGMMARRRAPPAAPRRTSSPSAACAARRPGRAWPWERRPSRRGAAALRAPGFAALGGRVVLAGAAAERPALGGRRSSWFARAGASTTPGARRGEQRGRCSSGQFCGRRAPSQAPPLPFSLANDPSSPSLFGYSQPGASLARGLRSISSGRRNERFPRYHGQDRHLTADAHREVRWADAVLGELGEQVL